LVRACEVAERSDRLSNFFSHFGNKFFVGVGSGCVPMPRIFERFYLRFRFFSALVSKEHVVAAVRVEGRIQVDEVYTLVRDVLAQDGKVVSIEQGVGGNGRLLCILLP
jgi:hypothetical protein